MNMKEFEKELRAVYTGSGYLMECVRQYLKISQTHGLNSSYDGSAGMAYFTGFKVFYHPGGYEVIADN